MMDPIDTAENQMEPEHKGHPEEEIPFGETIIFRFFVLFRNPAVTT